jgi:tRNA A58 N-methylase Trm61
MSDREERAARARDRARALKGQHVEAVAAPYLFVTPKETAEYVVGLAGIEPGMRVLEPSAGTGALLDEIPADCGVTAIEIDLNLADNLGRLYDTVRVIHGDFLEHEEGGYDRIVMNPPFDHGLDIKHILYARKLLAPEGRLVAICPDGPRQRETFEPIAELYEPLPEGTFAAAGTMVRTAVVVLEALA